MSHTRISSRKLTLNATLVEIPDANIRVGRQDFVDAGRLRELRQAHILTHVIKRRGDSILDVPLAAEHKPIGTPEDLDLSGDLGICQRLVLNAYLNYIAGLNRTVLDFDPVDFLADEDLLAGCLPAGVTLSEWLQVRLRYQLYLRICRTDGETPGLWLSLIARTATVISATCDVLLNQGMDLTGRYVQQILPSSDPRTLGRRKLLGKVVSTRDGEFELTDSLEGAERVRQKNVFLEPRRENLWHCIRGICGRDADAVIRSLEKKIAQANDGPSRLDRTRQILNHLRSQKLEMLPGVTIKLSDVISQSSAEIDFPAPNEESRPTYVFGPGATTDTWNDRGLEKHGPYDRSTFTPTTPRIAVICQARHRGQTELFLRKLVDGIPMVTTGNGRQPFGKGLVRKFCLDKCHFEFFEAAKSDSKSYSDAISRSIDFATERDEPWNLALIQIEERFHSLEGEANPYLVSKSAFLQRGIPSQEIELETMQVPDSQLVYILNNVSLACYAKLGGIPWLLQANRGIAHELVIGLGSAEIGEGRLGGRDRIVGITTIFSGDGNYLLENRTRSATMDEYPNVLMESLRASIDKVQRSMNWQPRDSVRLVFHAFKPFKREQIEAVKGLLAELTEYHVQYAFLHLVEDHPFVLFDEGNQDGAWDSPSKSKKGRLAPPRGLWLTLGDRETLLVLTGAREVKRAEDGMPTPLLLRLDRDSTFKDMKYLTRQVYHFACHSWRSFFPCPMPITVLYSDLIARLLGELSKLPKWDPQAMLSPIGRTRWFL